MEGPSPMESAAPIHGGTGCTHGRNGIRLQVLQTSFRATPCGAHSAPPAPLRALRGGVVGQLVGRDFDAAPSADALMVIVHFLQVCHTMQLGIGDSNL